MHCHTVHADSINCILPQGTKLSPLFLAVEEYIRETDEEKRKRRKELVELLLEQPDIHLDVSNKVLQPKYIKLDFFLTEQNDTSSCIV